MNQRLVSGPEALGAWLEAELPQLGRVRAIVKFTGGQSNPTCRIEGSAGTLVLRARPPGDLLKSGHTVEREFRVMRALAGSAVPVPRMLPHDGAMRGLGGLDRAALGIPDEVGYGTANCRRRGLPGIDGWTFFLAFSFFRLAAILEGVVVRARDGNASNSVTARAYGGAIPALARMAVELTQEGAE